MRLAGTEPFRRKILSVCVCVRAPRRTYVTDEDEQQTAEKGKSFVLDRYFSLVLGQRVARCCAYSGFFVCCQHAEFVLNDYGFVAWNMAPVERRRINEKSRRE